jgi:hypothetical protein
VPLHAAHRKPDRSSPSVPAFMSGLMHNRRPGTQAPFFPAFFSGLKSAATAGWIANVYVRVFHLLRLDIQQENLEIAVEQQALRREGGLGTPPTPQGYCPGLTVFESLGCRRR